MMSTSFNVDIPGIHDVYQKVYVINDYLDQLLFSTRDVLYSFYGLEKYEINEVLTVTIVPKKSQPKPIFRVTEIFGS